MSKDSYSLFAKLFHYIALNFSSIQDLSFSLDQNLCKLKNSDCPSNNQHIYVSGLARAGTTALMRFLYETGEFCSLTYRDMPLPLAQHLWKKMLSVSSKQNYQKERAHKDGILIGFDSPESIEEIFWRVFCGEQYIQSNKLVPMTADDSTIDKYRQYVATILYNNKMDRYLAKNNNNILRIVSVFQAFPNAFILIPFRDPIQQSLSLHNQHINFLNQHSSSSFTQKYMTWLAHHEFGFDHRYFDVGEHMSEFQPTSSSYWLDQWINVYSFLLRSCRDMSQVIFISFEMLCEHSNYVLSSLAEKINLANTKSSFSLKKANQRIGPNVASSRLDNAYHLYEKLCHRSFSQLQL